MQKALHEVFFVIAALKAVSEISLTKVNAICSCTNKNHTLQNSLLIT